MKLWAIIFSTFFAPQAENWYTMPADSFFKLPAVKAQINPRQPNYNLLAAAIFHATNQARTAEGKPALSHEEPLAQAARLHSESMRKNNFFAHRNPSSKRYRTPKLRIEKYSGEFKGFAENIARYAIYRLDKKGTFFVTPNGKLVDENNQPLEAETYFTLAKNIVSGWMNSPGHRANLLGNYHALGVGISQVFSENENQIPELYITQNFGRK